MNLVEEAVMWVSWERSPTLPLESGPLAATLQISTSPRPLAAGTTSTQPHLARQKKEARERIGRSETRRDRKEGSDSFSCNMLTSEWLNMCEKPKPQSLAAAQHEKDPVNVVVFRTSKGMATSSYWEDPEKSLCA